MTFTPKFIGSLVAALFIGVLGTSTIAGDRPAKGATLGRSPVLATRGMVATSQPLAAAAGLRVLQEGGNAIDAAIATAAVLHVVEPMMCGIGGDLFALVYEAESGQLYGLNATGRAGSLVSADELRSRGLERMPGSGIQAVTVPGALSGWDQLRSRFGSRPLAELLEPAIYYAEEGFPVSEIIATQWQGREEYLSRHPDAAETYLIDGRAPRPGEIFYSPDLAKTLRQIAAEGPETFYRGELGRRIADFIQSEGGFVTYEDLANHDADWVEPISTSYRDATVYQIPPNSQGFVALSMLNILEGFDVNALGHNSAEYLHVLIEAKKLAYADILRYIADQRFSQVPVEGILSKEYAKQRTALIDMEKANCSVGPGEPEFPGGDTIYLSVVDRDGNMISLIQSNYFEFGSGIVAGGTGFILQNRGSLFSLDPNHPNSLQPRKRPLHTIIPAMMTRGNVRIGFGIMGGWNQSQAHAQYVSNIVDHEMNIQAAMEAARFTKPTFGGCDLYVEGRITRAIYDDLTKRGHQIRPLGYFSEAVGGGQAVMRDESTGVNYGASDPRKDGAAIPEPAPTD